MNRGGVARTAPYLFLISVVTGIMSAAALGEAFTPARIAGALMVLAETMLVRVLGRRGAVPATTPEVASGPSLAMSRAAN